MRHLRSLVALALLGCCLATAAAAHPRPLPQRFYTLQPYYEYTRFEPGTAEELQFPHHHLDGYGARLWIHGASFHLPPNSWFALFASGISAQKSLPQRSAFYGGELDQYLARMPIAGAIDPFLSFGAGAYHRSLGGTRFAASPGAGIRIPIPNRSELRLEAHEQLIFRNGVDHEPVVDEHRLLFQTGLGFTF